MSPLLRIEMFVIAIFFLFFVIRSINKNHMSLNRAFGWLITSLFLVLFSIFPSLPEQLSDLFGFETPSNFLFLIAVFVLLILAIQNTIVTSKQQNQIKSLIQEVSILKSKVEKNNTK